MARKRRRTQNNRAEHWQSQREVKRIGVLPDEALLKIFDFYMNENPIHSAKWRAHAWLSLVHVCRRWRSLVFLSPLRMNLQLYCTPQTPAKDTLDLWPPLPLVIHGSIASSPNTDNVIAALGQNDRVCNVELHLAGWQLQEVLAAMQVPFPELTDLRLWSHNETPPVIPDSFLDGYSPRLRNFSLHGILFKFPGLRNVLLSAAHLVFLNLSAIPHSGYVSPETMVAFLSVMSNLEIFSLGFRSPRSRPNLESRSLPRLKRSILPALRRLHFKGVIEYLEELVTRIDTPQVDGMDITFFNQIDFNCRRLAQFINHAPKLRSRDEVHVQFDDNIAGISLRNRTSDFSLRVCELLINISCRETDWQLSSVEQVCKSFYPLATVEDLYIEHGYSQLIWKNDAIENILWLELLLHFTAVKNLYLSKEFAPGVATALQGLVGRTEVLPRLQNIFVEGLEPLGPLQESIEQFVAARKLSGHPIAISVSTSWTWKKQPKGSRRKVIQIDLLPDDVLFDVFDFYIKFYSSHRSKPATEAWQSLIHVCRRWRSLVFQAPRRLNLQLYCTPQTPVKDKLDIWPALPLIVAGNMVLSSGTDNVIAALRHNFRVRQVELNLSYWQLEEVLAAMQAPFPELTLMELSSDDKTPSVIPQSFLDISAPRLRDFSLYGIPFPGLPSLLLSATHLTHLHLTDIPHSGYISPEAMADFLSALSSLETLRLEFRSPQSHPRLESQSRGLPLLRYSFPFLNEFCFKGVTNYLEELVTRIVTPQLDGMDITFFNRIEFHCPRLAQFIGRTPLGALDEVHLQFDDSTAGISLRNRTSGSDELLINILCGEPDWQLSSMEQVCNSVLYYHVSVKDLYIEHEYSQLVWKNDAIEDALWLQLLLSFTTVENLYLSKEFAPGIAVALQELSIITGMLPNLQNIFVERLEPSVERDFIVAVQRLYDHPIAISVWRNDGDAAPAQEEPAVD